MLQRLLSTDIAIPLLSSGDNLVAGEDRQNQNECSFRLWDSDFTVPKTWVWAKWPEGFEP